MKPRILLLIDWFAPGYLAGGPVRSAVNFAYGMREQYEVRVLTTDRDLHQLEPYPGITPDQWTPFAPGIEVFYASPTALKWASIKALLQQEKADFVYLNSMYSQPFTIYPLLLAWSKRLSGQLILAPRGMLHPGALQYKSLKKQVFLQLIKVLGLHRLVHFQATDSQELGDIHRQFGKKVRVSEVSNWPMANQSPWEVPEKEAGSARMVYVSRIVPQKNLDFLLQVLGKMDGLRLRLDLIGPAENEVYWTHCKKLIGALPPGISVHFLGPLPHAEIQQQLKKYHFFVLATHSENFGHAIFEALLAGKPVLISDQTPWQNLEAQQVGWVSSLDQTRDFQRALESAVQMNPETYRRWSKSAWKFANHYLKTSSLLTDYQRLFSRKKNPV